MTPSDVRSNAESSLLGLVLVDDLIRQVAEEDGQAPLIAYPVFSCSTSSFKVYTARDIDTFVSNATECLIQRGLARQIGLDGTLSVVGLLGSSDIEFVISLLALSRLHYTVLLLSPRLTLHAYKSLMDETKCDTLVHSSNLTPKVREIKRELVLTSLPMVLDSDYTKTLSPRRTYLEEPRESSLGESAAFILHSSGSTGVPKCIYLTHTACLHNFSMGYPLRCFLTLPLYHMHGHSSLFRAIYKRKTCFMYNASLPLTAQNLVTAISSVRPELLLTVPYGLKLLSESPEGIGALQSCKMVSFAGSACPEELGDRLTACHVQLTSTYGLTEAGAILQSNCRDGKESWKYLRIIPAIKPYTWMKPLGDGASELVILDGLKSKIATNSNHPPNSFYTKDVFQAHRHRCDMWKYIGRLDDCVTLLNGEKLLPVAIEGRVRQDPAVKEAVVVGVGKAIPGLLVFRSEGWEGVSETEFIDKIWPAVEDANGITQAFCQIGRDMIISLPATRAFPQTDKGTILRAQLYQEFYKEISNMYEKLESPGCSGNGKLKLGLDALEAWLLSTFREELKVPLIDAQQDLFAAGVDSLQTSRMLSIINTTLDLEGAKLSTTAVYDAQNIHRLALNIQSLDSRQISRSGSETTTSTLISMIKAYSDFDGHRNEFFTPDSSSILITGGTGSLGSHLLNRLLQTPSVARIYCPVRASSLTEARARLLSSLEGHRLTPSAHMLDRVNIFQSDSESNCLPPHLIDELSFRITHIFHCAWPVNFNLPIHSFEYHISNLQSLLQFSLSTHTKEPAHLVFCSSISAALNHGSTVPEAPLAALESAAGTDYGRSKLVAEKIIQKAVEKAGAHATILRIGQIAGDSVTGIWNENEAIPLMVRSSLSIHALPAMDEECAWLPVDIVARSVLEFANLGIQDQGSTFSDGYVFNLVNPSTFSWKNDFLPTLRAAGLSFEIVSPHEWLQRMHDSTQDMVENPALKLLGYWDHTIGGNRDWSQRSHQDKTRDVKKDFATDLAQKISPTLRSAPNIVAEGLVARFLNEWLWKWNGNVSGLS